MQHRSYPTRPPTPSVPAAPAATFALDLLHGTWVASCPDCGHELGRSRNQETAERAGQRRRCPICPPDQLDRYARLAFLVAWLTAHGLDDQEAAS